MELIYKDFKIVVQEDSYDLYQKRSPKQLHKNRKFGKEVEVSLGYFQNIENCIKKIIRVEMATIKKKIDFSNFLKLQKAFWKDIDDSLKGYCGDKKY